MSEVEHGAVMVHLTYIKERVDQMNDHLVRLNGRVGDSEQEIAVLRDRSEELRKTGRSQGAMWGAITSGIIGGAIWMYQMFWGGR